MDNLDCPLFITGLPRSGTSMVAGLLHECGAWVGTTVPGGRENPKGFFEHIVIREKLTKKIISKLGHDPLGVDSLPELDQTLQVRDLDRIIKEIIIRDGYDCATPWLYKDAKLTLIWPAYSKAFPNAHWIIVRRQPEHIIDSCLRTSFMVQHSSERAFWQRFVDSYLDRLNTLQASVNKCTVLDADELIRGNYAAFQQLASRHKLDFSEEKLKHFISADYWHSDAKQNLRNDCQYIR